MSMKAQRWLVYTFSYETQIHGIGAEISVFQFVKKYPTTDVVKMLPINEYKSSTIIRHLYETHMHGKSAVYNFFSFISN